MIVSKNKLFFFILLFILISTPVFAQELSVEKSVKEGIIPVGGQATVVLKFTNPFDVDIPITIVDKNIFANNGIDIQCLEQTIPKKSEIAFEYSPITAYIEGKYKLEKAKITYISPLSGKEESVDSNTYVMDVGEGITKAQEQGITTIYNCNGTNMQSTSYSSSSSSQEQASDSQPDTQDKLKNINQQDNQNMQGLKNEMLEEQKKQQEQMQQLEKTIESNQEMYDEHKKLEDNGYKLSEKDISPESRETGDFEYKYQKENGDTASIKGNVANGSVEDISSFSSDDERRLKKALENNTEFKKALEGLKKEGFSVESKSIKPTTANMTNYNYQMSNPETNETAEIFGNMTMEGNVTSVEVEKHNNKKFPWFFAYLAALIALCCYLWSKYIKKPETLTIVEPQKKEKPINYKKESKKMLDAAEKLYSRGQKKQAYEKASEAVRFFFKHKFETDKKELTATETIILLKKEKKDTKNIKAFFNTTNLVNFAKYKPNDRDFTKILKIGNSVVSG